MAQARTELLNRVVSSEVVREEAARLVDDDIAHARHLREIIYAASGKLKARTLHDAALVMRAAAAYSTAIKNTSDIIRHTLRVERAIDESGSELPELVISELTADDIARLQLHDEPVEDDEDAAVIEDEAQDQDGTRESPLLLA